MQTVLMSSCTTVLVFLLWFVFDLFLVTSLLKSIKCCLVSAHMKVICSWCGIMLAVEVPEIHSQDISSHPLWKKKNVHIFKNVISHTLHHRKSKIFKNYQASYTHHFTNVTLLHETKINLWNSPIKWSVPQIKSSIYQHSATKGLCMLHSKWQKKAFIFAVACGNMCHYDLSFESAAPSWHNLLGELFTHLHIETY